MVVILLGNGFEPLEVVAPCDLLRRAGVETKLVSIHESRLVEAGHGIRVEADCTLAELDASAVELVMLPGGLGGVQALLTCSEALALVKQVYAQGGLVSAICAAPTILAKLGLTDEKKAVCYPGMEAQMGSAVMCDAGTVRDGRILTGRAAGSAVEFGLLLVQALRGADAAETVAREIVYNP